jgi:nitrite reductase (NADH) large subunit
MVIKITKRIVIIGNGIAGITAIKAIREIDLDSEVCLIGEEEFYPYNRIRLSKGIFNQLEANNILLQNQHSKKVIVVELLSRLMPYQLDDKASDMLKNIIQSYGILL